MRMRSRAALGALVLLLAAAWWLSRPQTLSPGMIPDYGPDLANGKRLFFAGGCASCHAKPDAEGDEILQLAGGLELESPYGTFVAPNISPHPQFGIGGWDDLDFVNAMLRGVSPNGRHYFPAFPYTSYTRMSVTDVLDLRAFIDSLPPVDAANAEHRISFPYGFRLPLGVWKRLFFTQNPVMDVKPGNPLLSRGRYLVEGPGHCGECHTPRNQLGALKMDQWLSGAPSLEGEGKVPDITAMGLSGWSEDDISYYLESGFDPDFDVVGGDMVKVQENMARLPAEDREAIAAYLKSLD